MIEAVDSLGELSCFGGRDIFSVRVLSLAQAYGFAYPFAKFYRQINDDMRVTAIVSVLDGDTVVSHLPEFDNDELADFFSFCGYSTLLSDEKFAVSAPFSQGIVMANDKKFQLDCYYTDINDYPSLSELYNFVDYDGVDFNAWYVDISHRIRHNAAKAAEIVNENGEIVSSAVFASVYNGDAVLTAVRTDPQMRRKGCGGSLVSSMCCSVCGTVYLMREADKNESFYKRLGFENIGYWRMYK